MINDQFQQRGQTYARHARRPEPPHGPLPILVSDLLAGLEGIHLMPPPPPRTMLWAVLETPFGRMFLAERGGAINSLSFLDGEGPGRTLAGLMDRWTQVSFQEAPEALEPFHAFLVAAMGGEVPSYRKGGPRPCAASAPPPP